MIGNACLFGQIASIMEALGLGYEETVHKIPYRNLMLMQRDKLRPCYGTKIHKTTGMDMMARRMALKNQ